jgi:hypothetical protein
MTCCVKRADSKFYQSQIRLNMLHIWFWCQFCRTKVRSQDAEAEAIQMRALTYALGIPLRVEIVDTKSTSGQAVRVKRLDFFNRSGLGKRPYHIVQSYYSSSTAHKPLERGSNDNLLSSDGAPLLTLLSRHGHCDILYPK